MAGWKAVLIIAALACNAGVRVYGDVVDQAVSLGHAISNEYNDGNEELSDALEGNYELADTLLSTGSDAGLGPAVAKEVRGVAATQKLDATNFATLGRTFNDLNTTAQVNVVAAVLQIPYKIYNDLSDKRRRSRKMLAHV